MNVAITLDAGTDADIKELVEIVRSLIHDRLVVMEAPPGFAGPFPLPLLTIEEDSARSRLAGDDAVRALKELAQQAA